MVLWSYGYVSTYQWNCTASGTAQNLQDGDVNVEEHGYEN